MSVQSADLLVVARPSGFDLSVIACKTGLLVHALKLEKDREKAEDLVQETMLRALANYKSYKDDTNLPGWLYTIQFNVFRSKFRKRRREVADTDGVFSSRLTESANQQNVVEWNEVRAQMALMPWAMRQALYLVAIQGESYEDAAEKLGVAVGTVKSRVNRARVILETKRVDLVPVEDGIPADGAPVLPDGAIREMFASGSSALDIAAKLSLSADDVMEFIAEKNLKRRT